LPEAMIARIPKINRYFVHTSIVVKEVDPIAYIYMKYNILGISPKLKITTPMRRKPVIRTTDTRPSFLIRTISITTLHSYMRLFD
jgi:hypothetical protein